MLVFIFGNGGTEKFEGLTAIQVVKKIFFETTSHNKMYIFMKFTNYY